MGLLGRHLQQSELLSLATFLDGDSARGGQIS
jgi:hypothetical protein